MKALVYTAPSQLVLRQVQEPVAAEGEVVLQVDSVCICGSDMHAYLGHDNRRPAPCILGHEVAGTILDGPEKGLRVTVNPLITCGSCPACLRGRNNLCQHRQIISMPPRSGAFAERVAMPRGNLVAIPDNVDSNKAALTEPLACAWHAVRVGQQALDVSLQQAKCLIFGGGAIGLGAALVLATHSACAVAIAETNPLRRKALQAIPEADGWQIFDPCQEMLTNIDFVIDAVGVGNSRASAMQALRPGGVMVHIGLGQGCEGLDIRQMTLQEITFIGSYTYSPRDFYETAQALFVGKLGSLEWIDVRSLDDGQRAFTDIIDGNISASKVVLKPQANC